MDKIIEGAYKPFTRVDVRRMYKSGSLTDAEVIRAYKDIGYDDDKAEKLYQFTKDWAEGSGEDVTTETKEFTRGVIIQLLSRGLYDEDTAIAELIEIGYSQPDATTLVSLELIKRDLDERDDQLKVIERRYDNNTITEAEALSEADKLDLAPTERDLFQTKLTAERLSRVKRPTVSTLTKMAKKGVIELDEYESTLLDLGYTELWAARFVELVELGLEGEDVSEQE